MTRRSWTRGRGAVRKIGGTWYLRFSRNGVRREEKTAARSRSEAEVLLRQRVAALDAGRYDLDAGKVHLSELYADLLRDYTIKGQNVKDPPKRWNHLNPAFGRDLVRTITTARITTYVDARLKAGAARATVKLELACLRRMLRLGFQAKKVMQLPYVPSLSVENARQGFFEREDFEAVRRNLPIHLRPLVTVAYWTGWRKNELLSLEWRRVDLTTGEMRLDPGTTKNKQGRVVYLPPEALDALGRWRRHTVKVERIQQRISPHVFHRRGQPIEDFYATWRGACKRAGVSDRLFHDLRRTSVRNYVRSGVSEHVAMAISGHKTRSVFDRYNIVSPGDLQVAAGQVATVRNGGVMGKVAPLRGTRTAGGSG